MQSTVNKLRTIEDVCVHFSDTYSAISDDEMRLLARIPNVMRITSDPWIGKESDISAKSYQHLSKLTKLSALELRVGDVVGIAYLCELSELHELSLVNSRISLKGMMELEELKFLRHLDLRRTNIDDRSVGILQSMTWLKSLKLTDTKISPEGIGYLRKRLQTTVVESEADSKKR